MKLLNKPRRAGNETQLLSWKHLIDVRQKFIFEKEKKIVGGRVWLVIAVKSISCTLSFSKAI